MFPIVPILGLLAIIGGGATLLWYNELDSKEKELANHYAGELFGKTVKELTSAEASRIHALVRGHFGN